MKIYRQLDNIQSSRLLFWTAWLAYASAYVGRLNFSAALATIIDQGVFTKSQAGFIGTVFFFCYGAGQLFSGIIADRFSPYKLIFTGLTLSAAANFFMFALNNYILITIVWGFNGIAQSLLWASVLFIISNILHEDIRYKACINIASSNVVGTLIAYIIAMICSGFRWNTVFAVSAIIMAAVSLIWLYVSMKIAKAEYKVIQTESESVEAGSPIKFRKLLTVSGIIIVMFAVMLHGMLKEGIMTWVPTMITETYQVKPVFSIFVSMILPVINLGGAYFATYLFEKITKRNEIITSVYIMSFIIIPLIVILFIGRIPLLLCIITLAMITMAMHAFNHVYITLAPLRFHRYNSTAKVTGIFNSMAYAGCAVSNFGFGWLSDIFGWKNTVYFWIGIAVIAVVFCLLTIKRWGKFISS